MAKHDGWRGSKICRVVKMCSNLQDQQFKHIYIYMYVYICVYIHIYVCKHIYTHTHTIKKAELQRINAFELWCWRRLLRVPWTARRSIKSILKEISPEYSLEGLMLKLKL